MIGCLLLLALLCSATAAALVWDGLHDEVAPADVAVVLGAQVWPNGQPALRLKARLAKIFFSLSLLAASQRLTQISFFQEATHVRNLFGKPGLI